MKFSASLFAAAAPCLLANGALAAALPPVTDGLNLDPSTVDTSVVDTSAVLKPVSGLTETVHNLVESLLGNPAGITDGLGNPAGITKGLGNHLAFLNIAIPSTGVDLPKRGLPAGDSVAPGQTAKLILDDRGFTEVWNAIITVSTSANNVVGTVVDTVVDTVGTVTPGDITLPTTEKRQLPEGVDVEAALKEVTEHVTEVIPVGTSPDSIFATVIPEGVDLHEFFGLPTNVDLENIKKTTEKLQDLVETPAGVEKQIQIIRLINGKLVTLKVTIKVLGLDAIQSWTRAIGN
ncbi:hypothetical protein QBC43DRAFT_361739 [Cladorrhinum sp. PSN259]|nr:hypothetical protein QBC43DRAFT_361739 [Cladorrhinum sp. PSN259]